MDLLERHPQVEHIARPNSALGINDRHQVVLADTNVEQLLVAEELDHVARGTNGRAGSRRSAVNDLEVLRPNAGRQLLAAIAFIPLNTAALAHWIRMGLVVALPLSGLALVLYPFLAKTPEREAEGKDPPHAMVTVLFGVALGLLVTLTPVGAGAIGVSVLAALYPPLPARRIVGSDIAHAVPLTLVGGMGHLGLGHVDLALLGVLLMGSIPGILLGARLAGAAPDWILRPVLGIMLCYAAWVLFNK